METQQNSGELFSFPELNFANASESNVKDDSNSPADRFFLNGRLLPHVFPIQQARRSSSVCSKESWMTCTPSNSSSRSSKESWMTCTPSNSSSRSSSCSSARTSSSDSSERNRFYVNNQSKIPLKIATVGSKEKNYLPNRNVYGYVPSNKWQFITPTPSLKPDLGRRKKAAVENAVKDDLRIKKSWLGRRFFRSFLFACRECHAMEPSTKDDELRGQ